jgi:hypothetical protein
VGPPAPKASGPGCGSCTIEVEMGRPCISTKRGTETLTARTRAQLPKCMIEAYTAACPADRRRGGDYLTSRTRYPYQNAFLGEGRLRVAALAGSSGWHPVILL